MSSCIIIHKLDIEINSNGVLHSPNKSAKNFDIPQNKNAKKQYWTQRYYWEYAVLIIK